MYSAYKLNMQGDNIQPWHTLFPIWNQFIVPCPVLTVASWPECRFLRTQIKWSGFPISKNFLVCFDPHSQKLWHSWWSRYTNVKKMSLLYMYLLGWNSHMPNIKSKLQKHIYSEILTKHLRHAIKICVYLFIYWLSVQIVKANKWALLSGRWEEGGKGIEYTQRTCTDLFSDLHLYLMFYFLR